MKEYIKEICDILTEYGIKNGEDYLNKEPKELAVIYENIKVLQEEYDLSDEDMDEVFNRIFSK